MMSRGELAGKRGASLSFSLSRRYQRQGLMKEALRAVIHELFQAEGLDYLHRGHFDFNLPSAKLQEKLGFTRLAARTFRREGENAYGGNYPVEPLRGIGAPGRRPGALLPIYIPHFVPFFAHKRRNSFVFNTTVIYLSHHLPGRERCENRP